MIGSVGVLPVLHVSKHSITTQSAYKLLKRQKPLFDPGIIPRRGNNITFTPNE
jgi:hypothetical protein